MLKRKRQFFIDLFIIFLTVLFGIWLQKSGFFDCLISLFGEFKFLSALVGGLFFTSVFTTGPAIIFLGDLSFGMPLWQLSIMGGIGAVCGDLIIFTFVRDRFSEDLNFLLSEKTKRFRKIFKTRFFRFFVPFLAALIIASPLPDELGITMFGLSKIKKINFIILSFVFNSLGILCIGFLAKILFY